MEKPPFQFGLKAVFVVLTGAAILAWGLSVGPALFIGKILGLACASAIVGTVAWLVHLLFQGRQPPDA